MVGCKVRLKKESCSTDWVNTLLRSRFFDSCVDHQELRKSEKNLFCIDCNLCFCKHCITSSSSSSSRTCFHRRLLQICKYVYHDVIRFHDIQKHFDCSFIQTYKINGEKAVHLNPRPQLKESKFSKTIRSGSTCCEACGRHIQDFPNRFCSIACKVLSNAKMKTDQISCKKPSSITEESSYENGYVSSSLSLSESASSEVIQTILRPRKVLQKRKSLPRRSPMC